MSPPRPAPTPALSQQVVDAVCEDLRAARLRPGDRLPIEPLLAQRFGVSRTVVREAMQHLRAMGLVHTRHGIGSFVLDAWPPLRLHGDACAPGGTRHLMAMLELRISVETEAAALAAVRRSEAQLDGMRQALQAFAAAAQAGHNTLKADFQFHRLIAQATGNPYFEDVLDSLGRHTIAGALPRPDDPAQFSPSGQPRLLAGKELTAHEHEAILDALQRGDALGARAAMLVHLGNSRGRLRRAIA